MVGRKDGVTADALTSIFSDAKAKQQQQQQQQEISSETSQQKDNKTSQDEDLSAELDALDIDGMNLDTDDEDDDHIDNDESSHHHESNDAKPPSSTRSNMSTTTSWSERPELYSKHFRPSRSEAAVLEEIAQDLDVYANLNNTGGGAPASNDNKDDGGGLFGFLTGGATSNSEEPSITTSDQQQLSIQTQWDLLVSGKNSYKTRTWPISILLKKGNVIYHDNNSNHDCELFLFTRGFLLAIRDAQGASGGFFGLGSKAALSPMGSALWTDIHCIHTTPSQSLVLTCAAGSDDTNEAINFEIVPSLDELDSWKQELQTAAIQAHQNLKTTAIHSLGWQYKLIQTPWFTEAITNNDRNNQPFEDDSEGQEMRLHNEDNNDSQAFLNQLDEYHGLAPLHYAVRLHHANAIRALLEAGANPNLPDKEGKSPMYYGTFPFVILYHQFFRDCCLDILFGNAFVNIAMYLVILLLSLRILVLFFCHKQNAD